MERFKNRKTAGHSLAKALEKFTDSGAVVLALPRGGVVLGAEIARALHAPLDLIITRKIGHPDNPEYAISAITESGIIIKNEAEVASILKSLFDQLAETGLTEARRRRKIYCGERAPLDIKNKTAIIVDDGLATGLTVQAALHEARARSPKKIIVAVPVASVNALEKIKHEADERICLHADPYFEAVGEYYEDFEQISDEDVSVLLKEFSNLYL
jgi:predicted phosphoribosyltransferase